METLNSVINDSVCLCYNSSDQYKLIQKINNIKFIQRRLGEKNQYPINIDRLSLIITW